MYTDEDLNFAVKEKILSAESVENFRALMFEQKSLGSEDEENFKLIRGFNDIFVAIACLLLLFSFLWVLNPTTGNSGLKLFSFTVLSWVLAEFFVLKRKMAFPAIILTLSFTGGILTTVLFFLMVQTRVCRLSWLQ